jgi:GTP cyclohydrolase I
MCEVYNVDMLFLNQKEKQIHLDVFQNNQLMLHLKHKEPEANEHSVKYNEPNRDYDSKYKPTKDDIETFPDLQNGPSSLIQGSPVEIQQVGIHNFRLPLKYATRDKRVVELETKVTGTVSLEAHKKGINMSRIMRSFY